MRSSVRIGIVAAVAAAAVGVLVAKQAARTSSAPVAKAAATGLPRLLDLGAQSCASCKAMVPVLDQLQREYVGQLQVDFIDVWKDERAGARYGLRSIPTQIFYSADGRELFRHEGFYSRDDIVARFGALGVRLDPAVAR